MGVTHIMRADEFIASTPKFLSIYDALGFDYPIFVSLPPILRDDRTKKLGKRDGAKDILDYRNEGFLPETMANFLALIGWNPGTDQEMFSLSELISAFELTKIQRAGATFNEEKLLWMNKQYLNKLSPELLLPYVKNALPIALKSSPNYSEALLNRLLPTVIERAHVAKDITLAAEAGEYDFAFSTPEYPRELLLWKNDTNVAETKPRLERALELLKKADFRSTESIKAALWTYAEEVGKGELLWPLRIALSGKSQSPDPFTLAYVIGMEETLKRIDAACGKIG